MDRGRLFNALILPGDDVRGESVHRKAGADLFDACSSGGARRRYGDRSVRRAGEIRHGLGGDASVRVREDVNDFQRFRNEQGSIPGSLDGGLLRLDGNEDVSVRLHFVVLLILETDVECDHAGILPAAFGKSRSGFPVRAVIFGKRLDDQCDRNAERLAARDSGDLETGRLRLIGHLDFGFFLRGLLFGLFLFRFLRGLLFRWFLFRFLRGLLFRIFLFRFLRGFLLFLSGKFQFRQRRFLLRCELAYRSFFGSLRSLLRALGSGRFLLRFFLWFFGFFLSGKILQDHVREFLHLFLQRHFRRRACFLRHDEDARRRNERQQDREESEKS